MAPKKKIIKKIVRKVKPKTQNPSPPSEPRSESPSAAAAGATDTLAPVYAVSSADASTVQETLVPEPPAEETLAPEPSTTAETLQSDKEPRTATETLKAENKLSTSTEILEAEKEPAAGNEILAELPAATEPLQTSAEPTETLAEEPAVATETVASETAEESTEAEKKAKTVTRVRKVIKKKIVKKLVPKGTLAKKEEAKVVGEVQVVEKQEEAEKPKEEDNEAVKETEMLDAGKGDNNVGDVEMEAAVGVSERKSRKKTEIFIGGLDKDAKEEDLRKVFGTVGEIVEVRMIKDGQSGKNKGYAFLRYADASHAKKAVTDFEKVEICGKLCGASALKENDRIFLGNIDKKWKKEDIIKLLQEIGIEKIEAVNVMPDPSNGNSNRGFAFLELETNKDAHNAYKKLQQKDAFGKNVNVKVAWAEPLNDPDEAEMKKVKSVYIEGMPSSWNEKKVKQYFKKFGEIERIVLASNIKSAKRNDYAFVNYKTRAAALLCIESFDKEGIMDNGSKVNLKVALAKGVQKGKQNKGGLKSSDKSVIGKKPKTAQGVTKSSISLSRGSYSRGGNINNNGAKSSTTNELLHVVREQATWKQGQIGYSGGPTPQDYTHGGLGKRTFSSMGDEGFYSDPRGYPRTRIDSFAPAGPSYGSTPRGMAEPSYPYYNRQDAGYQAGSRYGATEYSATSQMRQGAPTPYGNGSSGYYSRYGL